MKKDYLSHYGVMGMKWGVRKNRKSSSGGRKKSTVKVSSRPARKKTAKSAKSKKKTKKIKDMTNAELIKTRDRLRLEREVRTLSDETGPASKRVIKRAITKASEKTIEEVFHDVTKYTVGSLINKYAGVKVVNLKDEDKKKKKD